MEKVIAAIILVLLLWFSVPHLKQGEWIAPTAIAPNTWMEDMTLPEYRDMLATPSEGYGWYRYDFWNNPPSHGRSIERLKMP